MSVLINPFRFVSAGGFPVAFEWDSENGEALPGSATHTRASVGWYRNDSGVWVEASSGDERVHNRTAGGGSKGYLPEPSNTNLALHSRDFTNAAWSATNITPVKDATGIDNVSNAASTLTSTAANATILQSVTNGSTAHTFSVFVARKTGTGTIEITIDGGSTWVDITSSISSDIKDNPYTVTQTLANPSIGFRIVTSGDEIEVDQAQLEATGYFTTPMTTTSSTASRVVDKLLMTDATTEITAVIDATYKSPFTVVPYLFDVAGGGFRPLRVDGGGNTPECVLNGTIQLTTNKPTNGDRKKYAFTTNSVDRKAITATDMGYVESGSTSDVDGLATSLGSDTDANTNSHWGGVIHSIKIYSTDLTQSELEAEVA